MGDCCAWMVMGSMVRVKDALITTVVPEIVVGLGGVPALKEKLSVGLCVAGGKSLPVPVPAPTPVLHRSFMEVRATGITRISLAFTC